MPLQGAASGSVAHPNASGDVSDDTEHSFAVRAACVLQAPATFESDGTDVTCLQDAKVGRWIFLSCLLMHHSETCFAVNARLLLQHNKATCCTNVLQLRAQDVVCSSM